MFANLAQYEGEVDVFFSHIQDGILLEPEMDETLLQPRFEETSYFMRASEKDFDEMLKNFKIEIEEDADIDDDDDEDATTFERLARKMQNVTSDGGVKKRVSYGAIYCS